MKRKLLLLSVLAICVATLAAGTLAYFSADGTARNVITTGNVSIAVEEWADADKTQPFEDLTGIMPGTTVTKIAEVRNTGEADAWIRVRLTGDIRLTGDGTPDPSLVKPDLNHRLDAGSRRLPLLQQGHPPRRDHRPSVHLRHL